MFVALEAAILRSWHTINSIICTDMQSSKQKTENKYNMLFHVDNNI